MRCVNLQGTNISVYIRFRNENYLLCKIYNTEPYEK